MNIAILGAMLKQGCVQKTFPYVCEIMQISLDENIKPNHIFLKHLNSFYLQCARAIDARVSMLSDAVIWHTRFKLCSLIPVTF